MEDQWREVDPPEFQPARARNDESLRYEEHDLDAEYGQSESAGFGVEGAGCRVEGWGLRVMG